MLPKIGSQQLPIQGSFSPDEEKQYSDDVNEDEVPKRKQKFKWRGLTWRVNLGILPPTTAPINELRHATADGRRRYAEFRRRFLVDPHLLEESQAPPYNINMDNPLSLNPDSVWGRFFQNVELERTIDKDLSRLYPEHGSYFQGQSCQSMLRRVLLVWSLINSNCSYRQGMHELLAPILYVLHVDLEKFSHIKGRHEDHFDEGFTRSSLQSLSTDLVEKTREARSVYGQSSSYLGALCNILEPFSEHTLQPDIAASLHDMDDFDADVAMILMGSDLYGAEGELGSLFSGRFMEHDAYCMFDALMTGQGGALAMADYFIGSSEGGSPLAVPPIIEASAALYRTLAAADVSLYAHFVELGVEPQFFSLRWLRLLFGREFSFEDLLHVWDAIFAASNEVFSEEPGNEHIYGLKNSSRSAFIYALAVSMLLYLRPALLSAPDATGCLQKLLNFPHISDVRSLIDSAKFLLPLAEEAAKTPPAPIPRSARLSELSRSGKHTRSATLSSPTSLGHVKYRRNSALQLHKSISCSPEILRSTLPESYWEERWKNLILQKDLLDEFSSKQSEVLETRSCNEQPQIERNFDSLYEKQQDDALAGNAFCDNAQPHQNKDHTVSTVSCNEETSADLIIPLPVNGNTNSGSNVRGASTVVCVSEKEGKSKSVGFSDDHDKDIQNESFDFKNSAPLDTNNEGLLHNSSTLYMHSQENGNITSQTRSLNGDCGQFYPEEVMHPIDPLVKDGQLVRRLRTLVREHDKESSHFSEKCDSQIASLSDFRTVANNQSIPSMFEDLSDKQESVHLPLSEGLLGTVSSGCLSEVICEPTFEENTSEMTESTHYLERLQPMEASRTLAWISNLDKLNLGQKSFISTIEQGSMEDETLSCNEFMSRTVSATAQPQKTKYMWNPKNLDIEGYSLSARNSTSNSMERQGQCSNGKEHQYDSLGNPEHSKKTTESISIVQLQAIGQSMLEQIQILESTVTGRHLNCESGLTTDGSTDGSSEANYDKGGNLASLVALSQLRKIGGFLQQL